MEQIDRVEFEKRLKSIYSIINVYSPDEILRALVFNDVDTIASIQTALTTKETTINSYLTLWDNAATQQDKDNVVGMVGSS